MSVSACLTSGGSTLGREAQPPPNRGYPPNLAVLLTLWSIDFAAW